MEKLTREQVIKKLGKGKKDFKGLDLSGLDLSGLDLRGVNLSSTDLSYSTLSKANLTYADLSHSDLSNAYLIYTDLSYANLENTNLSCANLINANLSCADLFKTNLSYAYLSNANLKCANLSGSNLNHTDLSDTDLSGTALDKTINNPEKEKETMEQSLKSLINALITHKEAIEKMHKDINKLVAEVTIIKQVFINELYEIYKKLFGSEFANAKKELIEKVINESLESSLSKISEMEEINNGKINKRRSNREIK